MQRRWKRMMVVAVVAGVVVAGGAAYASHQFNDVPDSNIFHEDIDFIASRAITLGCGGGNYCPDEFVPREQMAAFLQRMSSVLTPEVTTATGYITTGTSEGNCLIGPYTPIFERTATFTGGLYSSDAPADGRLMGRVTYSANGGAWQDVTGAWNMPDGSSAAGEHMASPVGGAVAMSPGVAYRFSIEVNANDGTTDMGCQLIATLFHRMPGQGVGASAAAASVGGGSN